MEEVAPEPNGAPQWQASGSSSAPQAGQPAQRSPASKRPDRDEVDLLVRRFIEGGGQVTVCPPGDAMTTGSSALDIRLRRAERLAIANGSALIRGVGTGRV
jgi:hypothetical protein